ncbi:MAG: hypothetical protein MUF72_13510 [Elainella sp. Prado103]|nr:hypothetical protein [Elainella sp. Prado103]
MTTLRFISRRICRSVCRSEGTQYVIIFNRVFNIRDRLAMVEKRSVFGQLVTASNWLRQATGYGKQLVTASNWLRHSA